MMTAKPDKMTVAESSGNVFADLGCKNPEELKVKAQITAAVAA